MIVLSLLKRLEADQICASLTATPAVSAFLKDAFGTLHRRQTCNMHLSLQTCKAIIATHHRYSMTMKS